MVFTEMFLIYLNNFDFHPISNETFLVTPNLTEAIGLYPNAPNVLKCSKFTQNLNEFFSLPKFGGSCWNYHMIPVHSKAVPNLPSGAKKNGKIISDYSQIYNLRFISDYFVVDLAIILH